MKKISAMLFSYIYDFLLKVFRCFKNLFYSLISKIKSKYNPLSDLKTNYEYFIQVIQEYTEVKKQNFPEAFEIAIIHLAKELKLESIRFVNGNNLKIIKEWKSIKAEDFILSYNKEIQNTIVSNLKKNEDKLQIKIKVDKKVKEFVFGEFKVSGDCVKFSNCRFSTQKECYLDYFPKKIHSIDYVLNYKTFLIFLGSLPSEKYRVKNITGEENIENLTIRTPVPANLFFNMKILKKDFNFEFTDFNLSIKQSEDFEEEKNINNLEEKVFYKRLTMFFEATKKISKITFDVFVSAMNLEGKQIGCAKISVGIFKDGKVTRKVEANSFILMEIQQEENSLKIILCRPTVHTKNPIKAKDSLSIDFMDLTRDFKSTNIILDAEAKTEGDFIHTIFTVKKNEIKNKKSNLYDAMMNYAFVSITLNGENGIIGTYGCTVYAFNAQNCIYSDKLIRIPSGKKRSFFTKNDLIVFFVVCLLIFISIIAYFYKTSIKKI